MNDLNWRGHDDEGGHVTRAEDSAIDEFRERFAQIMVESGMPRMAARAYAALLVTNEGRLSAAELGESLDAGASAISGAVTYLTRMRLIERRREPGTRRDLWQIHEHTWSHYISQTDPVFVKVQTGADEGIALLGLDTPAGRRLDETRRFFAFMREEVKQSMAKWRRLQEDEPARNLGPGWRVSGARTNSRAARTVAAKVSGSRARPGSVVNSF